MPYSPIDNWTPDQKIQFLVLLKKLTIQLQQEDNQEVEAVFKDYYNALEVPEIEFMLTFMHELEHRTITNKAFDSFSYADRFFVLVSFLLVLLSRTSFEADHYRKTLNWFNHFFKVLDFDTMAVTEIIYSENKEMKYMFQSKLIKEKEPTITESVFSKDNMIFLVIMALAILGLVSLLT